MISTVSFEASCSLRSTCRVEEDEEWARREEREERWVERRGWVGEGRGNGIRGRMRKWYLADGNISPSASVA